MGVPKPLVIFGLLAVAEVDHALPDAEHPMRAGRPGSRICSRPWERCRGPKRGPCGRRRLGGTPHPPWSERANRLQCGAGASALGACPWDASGSRKPRQHAEVPRYRAMVRMLDTASVTFGQGRCRQDTGPCGKAANDALTTPLGRAPKPNLQSGQRAA